MNATWPDVAVIAALLLLNPISLAVILSGVASIVGAWRNPEAP